MEQARDAVKFVLDNLNPRDRFNVIAFSTGTRIYARASAAGRSAPREEWISGLEAIGSTDIGAARAMDMAARERPTVAIV